MAARRILLCACLAVLGASTLLTARAQDAPESPRSYALRAEKILTVSGEPLEPGVIWIDDGKIREIGKEIDLPEGVEVRDLGDRVILPGLVDGHSHLGGYLDLAETVTASTPAVRAADALDPFHPAIEAALADGITCHLLAPRGENTLAGICAVVKPTAGEDGARVLVEEVGLKVSFSARSLRRDRRPTSRAGAVALFREEAKKAWGADGSKELRRALSGEWPVFIDASDRGEISSALRVMKEFDLSGTLVHATWGRDLSRSIEGSGAACIVGPLGPGNPREVLETPGALEAAGVKVAFGSDSPIGTRDSLRLTAALAVRHGMSPKGALRALTLTPAELAGVADRVGSLEKGKTADLLILDGDPLDLSTRVVEVILEGKEAYVMDKERDKEREEE